ncbi:hypothetical protein IAQ61_007761 [Plenodomus lingam]|uniref:uncharacterized protein n=1 Tax=Leptosphaeria maculans TaxID=5022 RepID=UPI00331A0A6D|nr:hypothetical protein IAQ61_007761 [Plenodomus lingam]
MSDLAVVQQPVAQVDLAKWTADIYPHGYSSCFCWSLFSPPIRLQGKVIWFKDEWRKLRLAERVVLVTSAAVAVHHWDR